MACVEPFSAWHYDTRQVSLAKVIAPPYDVISTIGREELLKRDPHNVIRLILGQAAPEEIGEDRRYEEAAKRLAAWAKDGILSRAKEPAYYLHEMTFAHPHQNVNLTRLALFGRLKLEAFGSGSVYPHENTHALAKADRLKLLRATHANFSPIFLLHEDSENQIGQMRACLGAEAPLFNFTDGECAQHKVWPVSGASETQAIARMFQEQKVFIADGHHRCETALRHSKEEGASRGSGYVLSAFVRFSDPGLLVLPIHRLACVPASFDHNRFLDGLKQHFILHSVQRSVLEKISEGAIQEGLGLALSESECYLLELKDRTAARREMPKEKPGAWYDLDVALVSCLVFKPLLGIEESNLEKRVRYTPSCEEAFQALGKKEADLSFFIRPLNVRAIKEICESGALMPQKSTYFYPKFPSGLLLYRHENE